MNQTLKRMQRAFRAHGLPCEYEHYMDVEILFSTVTVDKKEIRAAMIPCEEEHRLAWRAYGIVSEIPQEKRAIAVELCNGLNDGSQYNKFSLDKSGAITAAYDFPPYASADCMGEAAVEIYKELKLLMELRKKELQQLW